MVSSKKNASARNTKVKRRCMFCGEPVLLRKEGGKREISSWYGGCHASCLYNYNIKHIAR